MPFLVKSKILRLVSKQMWKNSFLWQYALQKIDMYKNYLFKYLEITNCWISRSDVCYAVDVFKFNSLTWDVLEQVRPEVGIKSSPIFQ